MLTAFELFNRQVSRELLIHGRDYRGVINACLFFVLVCLFFPLAMPPDKHLLHTVAPGLVWIAALLALFLSAERLFQADAEDGLIEQWIVSGYSMSLLVGAKLFVHWLFDALPMIFLCPLLALFFGLRLDEVMILALSLVCGTPAILALCALSSAFGLGLKQKSVLMGLILFPLTIPVLILGSSVMALFSEGMPVSGYLALLLALSCLACGLLPFAIAGIIRMTSV